MLHNRLKTREELVSHHLNIGPSCERYGYGLENTIHVLHDRLYSREVWFRLLCGLNHHNFFNANLADWMSMNLQASNNFLGRVIFGIAIWRLWFWRNQFTFTKAYWESNNVAMDLKLGPLKFNEVIRPLLLLACPISKDGFAGLLPFGLGLN